MRFKAISLLINDWYKIKLSSVIHAFLKSKTYQPILFFFLFFDQLFKWHFFCIIWKILTRFQALGLDSGLGLGWLAGQGLAGAGWARPRDPRLWGNMVSSWATWLAVANGKLPVGRELTIQMIPIIQLARAAGPVIASIAKLKQDFSIADLQN